MRSTFTNSIFKSAIFYILTAALSLSHASPLPVFSTDIKGKKQQFFNFMAPMAEVVNDQIIKDRTQIQQLQKVSKLTVAQQKWLSVIAKKYKVANWTLKNQESWRELLTRVDIVPTSLLLAQSANESAWGSSRFARKGNNLFGQWCFTKGCGIVPNRRNAGSIHEVRTFTSVADSVQAYMYNLNTNRNYKLLREIRAELRKSDAKISGEELAVGLINYSQRREAYVKEIKQMIRYNKLVKYDIL